ncbi:hypothetical protein A3Q56_05470 [Intoshia linei]|uniref:Uncharacterized protein n=1 Tax=Intoshia linei TaxID=1819745 RepID=A0A177AXR2_9BILA|nr:hypothetical protein A3Q56_05470 [Intoshia linei]
MIARNGEFSNNIENKTNDAIDLNDFWPNDHSTLSHILFESYKTSNLS